MPVSTATRPRRSTAPAADASAADGFWRKSTTGLHVSVTDASPDATYTPWRAPSAISANHATPVRPGREKSTLEGSTVISTSPERTSSCPPAGTGRRSASRTMRSKRASGRPSSETHGNGVNALPIAAYAGVRRLSPPEWHTRMRRPLKGSFPFARRSSSTRTFSVAPRDPTRRPPGSGTTITSVRSSKKPFARRHATCSRYPAACASFAAVMTIASNMPNPFR